MSGVVPRRSQQSKRGEARTFSLIVVGREGTRELGDYLLTYLSSRGDRVDGLLAFDHVDRLSLYHVGTDISNIRRGPVMGQDVVVGLSDSSTGYEKHLSTRGSFVLDSSKITTFPARDDINLVTVPASMLARATLAGSPEKPEGPGSHEMVVSVMLGAVLAVLEEQPATGELNRLFLMFHPPPVLSFVRAACEGYDRVRDMQMRGKSSMVGVEQ